MELHTAYLVQAHANFNHQRVKHLHMEGHTPPNIVSYNSLEIYPPVETGEGPRPASEDTQLIDEFYTSVFGEPPKHEPVLLQTSHVSPKDEVRETGTNFSGSSISVVHRFPQLVSNKIDHINGREQSRQSVESRRITCATMRLLSTRLSRNLMLPILLS
mmetsp:Transcript_33608/g.41315  ORF Transcript_33608/g.41315 Transcript_33608/m.41315 type:complete len:159 (+) Transcript_33608:415-891(+)